VQLQRKWLAAAKEEGDIRSAGTDIQHHETATGIL
jgi:hypothetical protein